MNFISRRRFILCGFSCIKYKVYMVLCGVSCIKYKVYIVLFGFSLMKYKVNIVLWAHLLFKGKCNFKWLSIQRWQCSIYNGTLKSFVWSNMNYIFLFLVSLNELSSLVNSLRKWLFITEISTFRIRKTTLSLTFLNREWF